VNLVLAATVLITLVAGCNPTTPSPSEPAPTNVAVVSSPSAAAIAPAVDGSLMDLVAPKDG
jgi:hypothetical protein